MAKMPPGWGKQPSYTPKFESGLPNENVWEENRPSEAEPWVMKPTSGHILRFAWIPVRAGLPQGNLGGFLWRLPTALGRRRSELRVQFKDKFGKPTQTYTYFFSDMSEGQRIADALAEAEHPYSTVLYPEIVKPAVVPYTKIAES